MTLQDMIDQIEINANGLAAIATSFLSTREVVARRHSQEIDLDLASLQEQLTKIQACRQKICSLQWRPNRDA